uniref:Uncharacterized protein n=1 Tax=Knipowitschia caucasica TaxID=637954 RepID=A0AAV2JYE9_KNICA
MAKFDEYRSWEPKASKEVFIALCKKINMILKDPFPPQGTIRNLLQQQFPVPAGTSPLETEPTSAAVERQSEKALPCLAWWRGKRRSEEAPDPGKSTVTLTTRSGRVNPCRASANVDADVLQTLTREDLKDLFPGPEHFRRRKAIWDLAHPVEQATEESGTDCLQYPTKEGLQAMARRIMDYYSMVADWADTSCPWSDIFKKLNKRLQNIKSPQKWQGATPSRGNGKRRRLSFENTTGKELTDEGEEPVVDLSPCASKVSPSPKLHDSRIAQARHYKTLQEMFRKPKQDKEAVAQLLDLEFEARRNFIDADLLKEPDKAAKIIDAYPCFKDIDHALDEVGRIIAKGQHNYAMELRERWEVFKQKLIYAVLQEGNETTDVTF